MQEKLEKVEFYIKKDQLINQCFLLIGKSRADLWQLAGLVALEQSLERANRACDLDFHARQQVCMKNAD